MFYSCQLKMALFNGALALLLGPQEMHHSCENMETRGSAVCHAVQVVTARRIAMLVTEGMH